MKKLAIVGTHPDTRENAPFDSPEFDIWVQNEAAQMDWCKRWNACFQMHKMEVYTSPNNPTRNDHWDWLQQDHGERAIWMQDRDERVPNSKKYPLEDILKTVPGAAWQYFDLTGAYMMALAIHLGYREIEIYGMDLISNTEYTYQLGCWRFWVGIALGSGINVVLKCEENDFGHGVMYAYQGELQIDRAFFGARKVMLEKVWKEADEALHLAQAKVKHALKERRHSEMKDLVENYQAAAVAAGEISGALSEAKFYEKREDPISRQEFEKRSALGQHEAESFRAMMYNAGGKAEYVAAYWFTTADPQALSQVQLFLGKQMEAAFDLGARSGIFRENFEYMQEIDRLITASGGKKTIQSVSAAPVEQKPAQKRSRKAK